MACAVLGPVEVMAPRRDEIQTIRRSNRVQSDPKLRVSFATVPSAVVKNNNAAEGRRKRFMNLPPGLTPPAGSPSHGSVLHGTGRCRPCAWFWKDGGCLNGEECRHCHLCPEDEIKSRKKAKAQAGGSRRAQQLKAKKAKKKELESELCSSDPTASGDEETMEPTVTELSKRAGSDDAEDSTSCSGSDASPQSNIQSSVSEQDDEGFTVTSSAELSAFSRARQLTDMSDVLPLGSSDVESNADDDWVYQDSADEDEDAEANDDDEVSSVGSVAKDLSSLLKPITPDTSSDGPLKLDLGLLEPVKLSWMPESGMLEATPVNAHHSTVLRTMQEKSALDAQPKAAMEEPWLPPLSSLVLRLFDEEMEANKDQGHEAVTGAAAVCGLIPPPPGFEADQLMGSLPSTGSELHFQGRCRPCGWFWKPEGCQNGRDCLHCHLCPDGEVKARKKARQQAKRQTEAIAAKGGRRYTK
mmetsp:Transcript_45103/g.107228  ORF Transcript_45103/g.107228 Transcript_45103/m.107228 type:complete len:469 (+) Transcript_45103:66-1472(+)|eukprot:CAMPEP_0178418708 /NCGR_PEP_ID=MMETSP0689_2-20121128/25230_1 /TAXON_ID=160604 /ORGANISM="Amphidinium massartii, Strain CS-259" /LENGTH=468 /DNA_ID=CAMNT_0020040115 /DNA_START=227 /DNA_END=1633 /DNA_ORIENTATION=+